MTLAVFSSICSRDDEEKKKSPSDGTDEKDNANQSKAANRISNSNNPFLDIPHDPNAAVYKTGFLARKIHADMDGKKSECLPTEGNWCGSLCAAMREALPEARRE